MKFGIVFLTVLVFVFTSANLCAQNSPQQIRILNNYGAIPFEDGKTIVAEVKFTGVDGEEGEFRKVFNANREAIRPDDAFYGYKVAKTVKLLKESLVSKGYVNAEIVALGEQLPNDEMRLVFEIKKGALVEVSEIRFVGNKAISSAEFVEDIKQNSDDGWKIFTERKYEYYVQKFSRTLAFSKGYFQMKIKRVTPQIVGNGYVVTVEVEEGRRFLWGEIKISGAEVFSEKEILEMLGQKTGDVADGKKFQNFIYEKLKRAYADKGYPLYDAEFEPKFIDSQTEDSDSTVDVLINIDEGTKFKISRISFVGVEKEKERELKEIFGFKEGDVYNQSKFEDGIKKINDLKEFDFIDKDSDVEIRTDQESGEIDFVIKVVKVQ